ncbi:MAG: IS1634 family transposase, partial [Nitrococcus sp.]|nr:IS1634 family transposase [Nitrococcus sp.]
MFIRRTATGRGPDGERYYTHRLVSTQRIGGKVRQRTLLNLGAHFAIERGHWGLLCQCVDERLHGQSGLNLEAVPTAVEAEAERMTAQLLTRQRPASSQGASATGDVQSVDIDSMTLTRPRSVGLEQLGLWAMAQVDFAGLLGDCGCNGPQRGAAIGTIIARMAAPGSEQATYRWLRSRSALGELLAYDYETMDDMALYRISDRLYRQRAWIEAALFERVRDLFGLECVITLYDLTNTYFEGRAAGNPQARHGHSKEKRSDCPLLTLAMVLDGSGFVRRSQVFGGNAGEANTLDAMLSGLDAPAGALVVMDRGIASQANLDWLVERGYRYLVVSRERRRTFDAQAATPITTASDERVHIQSVPSDNGQELYLYCHSEARARKEEGIDRRFAERFEAALQGIHDGLSKPRTTKRIDKLWERIGRLKEKSRGIGGHYDIELIPDDSGEKAVALRWQRRATPNSRVSHPGVYCLRTNETDWDADKLWRTYTMLTDLEAVFRSLKSELGLRPIYHHKQERSAGHLFISVLAYQFVQILRRCLREHGVTDRWGSLRERMGGQCRITATFRRADGRTLHVRKTTQPEPAQKDIYAALGIDAMPGGVR